MEQLTAFLSFEIFSSLSRTPLSYPIMTLSLWARLAALGTPGLLEEQQKTRTEAEEVGVFTGETTAINLPIKNRYKQANVTLSAFTCHSSKPNYCVRPTMIGSLRCTYTP